MASMKTFVCKGSEHRGAIDIAVADLQVGNCQSEVVANCCIE